MDGDLKNTSIEADLELDHAQAAPIKLDGGGSGTSGSPAGPAAAAGASVPFIITKAAQAKLRALGLSQETIDRMDPQEAHRILELSSGIKVPAKSVSPQKLAANIRNAQLSTGPRTAAGKARSGLNAFKQGFYTRHLFPTAALWEAGKADYEALATGLRDYYRPRNFMVEILVEKLVTEMIRHARITHQEALLYASGYPFDGPRIDRMVRNRNATEKAIYRVMEEIETLQEHGGAAFGQSGSGLRGDSREGGAPSASAAVGPHGHPRSGGDTGGESAFADTSDDSPESGDAAWVASENVIFQGPTADPPASSNQRVDTPAVLHRTPIAANRRQPPSPSDQATTAGPKKATRVPYSSLARIILDSVGLPDPSDEPQSDMNVFGGTKPTGQPSQSETPGPEMMASAVHKAQDNPNAKNEPELAPERNGKKKPIQTIAPPASFDK
jgi:hypothetical protein